MKKLLLATSILAGTAGLAAAEVTLSGSARMGFIDDVVLDPLGDDDIGFTSRARVEFTMSGETDGGLSFGASFRADNAGGANSGTAGSVFLSGAFGKVSMGDVDGAANAAVGHVDGVGLTGLGDRNESVFIASGGLDDDNVNTVASIDPDLGSLTGDPSVLYEYTTGNIGLFASVTNPGHEIEGLFANDADGLSWSVAANYTMDAYKFSIGYEDLEVDEIDGPGILEGDHIIVGADATFGAFTAKARYGQADLDLNNAAASDFTQWAISGTYAMDAISVTGFLSNKQFDAPVTGANQLESDTMGLGASYDLGGGAKVVGGIIDTERTEGALASQSDTAFDFGVSFSF